MCHVQSVFFGVKNGFSKFLLRELELHILATIRVYEKSPPKKVSETKLKLKWFETLTEYFRHRGSILKALEKMRLWKGFC